MASTARLGEVPIDGDGWGLSGLGFSSEKKLSKREGNGGLPRAL
jgi:hypothetical protein